MGSRGGRSRRGRAARRPGRRGDAASLSPALAALEAAFEHLAGSLFGGALGPAVVAIAPRGRRKAWGWYRPAGYDGGADTLAEVAVAAEGLRRPPEDTLLALLVQMVRHRNAGASVKDCASKGGRLNRTFAAAATAAGLVPPARPDKRTGYADVALGERAALEVGTLAPTLAAACALARVPEAPGGPGKFKSFACECAGVPKVWTYRNNFDQTVCPFCRTRYRWVKRPA